MQAIGVPLALPVLLNCRNAHDDKRPPRTSLTSKALAEPVAHLPTPPSATLPPLNLPANYDADLPEFEERVYLKLAYDVRDQRHQQRLQIPVADVPGRDQ